jgi:hypothetical protein
MTRTVDVDDLLADRFLRAAVLARRDTSEHPLEHDAGELITVSEMLVGHQRHLRLPVSGPRPWAFDLHPPATERHLPVLVAVADRCAVAVPPPLRADQLIDLLLQQPSEHVQPDLDRERQQTLPRCPQHLQEPPGHAPGARPQT